MPDTAPTDARTLNREEYAQHLDSIGMHDEAHRVRLYGTRPPTTSARAPGPARAKAARNVVDARSMTPQQWQQHCARLNAGDLANESFVGQDGRELVDAAEPTEQAPEINARKMSREQLREHVASIAPDVVSEVFGPSPMGVRPLPSNAAIDAAVVSELERLRGTARVQPEQYHVDDAGEIVRKLSRELGVHEREVLQASVRLQAKGRLMLDRTGAGGVEKWGLVLQQRRGSAVGGDAL